MCFTYLEVADLLVQVMDTIFEKLSDEEVDAALERFGELIESISDMRAGFPPRRKAPPAEPPRARGVADARGNHERPGTMG